MRVDHSRWACTVEKRSDTTRYDLTMGVKVKTAVTVGADVIGGVPVWHVSAQITGPQHASGEAVYYVTQSDFTLLRLVMTVSEVRVGVPRPKLKETIDYSRYGEMVVSRLPKGCHYFKGTSARYEAFIVEGQAMEPNYHSGQVVWVDLQAYRHHPPERGDVIVFRTVPAGLPDRDSIKRIIGLPGETIAIHNNAVYINNKPLHEKDSREPMSYTFPRARIPKNDYFVLGDNRDNSEDSHLWRWLPRSDIIGKVVLS
jgi:signal peptidase I